MRDICTSFVRYDKDNADIDIVNDYMEVRV